MKKFMSFFEDKIMPPFMKVAENPILQAMRNGIALTMPLTIIGSIFMIIANLPIDNWADILGDFQPMLSMPTNFTYSILGIVACLGITYYMAEHYKVDKINAMSIALVLYLMAQCNDDWSLNVDALGASGLFTGIIIAFITVLVFHFFIKRNMVLRMPKGVPPAVAETFVSLVPALFLIALLWVIRVLLHFNINETVTAIFSPLAVGLNTLPGMLLYVLFILLLWCCGLHGSNIMGTIGDPVFLTMMASNVEAFQNGDPLPYAFAGGFYITYLCLGGTGSTLGLVINMLFSKSKAYRTLGRMSLPSAIFCINEPVVFGFPIVMNPIMMIPYILTPIILCIGSYILIITNVISAVVFSPPWTTPPLMNAYLATGGNIPSVIWSFISIFISVVIYFPFFKISEKQQILREKEEEN